MGKVRLELLSGIAYAIDATTGSEERLEIEIGENKTVGDILSELAMKYPRFGQYFFDAKTRKLDERVSILLNGNMLTLTNRLETRLKDGDTLTLLPLMAGG